VLESIYFPLKRELGRGAMYKVIPRDEFEDELDQIEEYVSEELYNPDAAERIVDSIYKAVDYLEDFPKLHPIYEVIQNEGYVYEYRRIVKGNYSVLYYINEDEKTVYLAHIYNHRQKFDIRLLGSSRFVNEGGVDYNITQEREMILMLDICPKSIKECWNINLTDKTIEHVMVDAEKFESRIYQVGDVIQTKHVTLDVAEAFGLQ